MSLSLCDKKSKTTISVNGKDKCEYKAEIRVKTKLYDSLMSRAGHSDDRVARSQFFNLPVGQAFFKVNLPYGNIYLPRTIGQALVLGAVRTSKVTYLCTKNKKNMNMFKTVIPCYSVPLNARRSSPLMGPIP